jgi:lipopolysaccharide export system permease protein
MKILKNYIGKTLLGTILLVILVLTALEVFIEFTREFGDIGQGYYGWLQVLQFVPMMLPQDIYQLFPMAGLLGSLIGLGLLTSHSELTVMRSSGVSVLNVTWAVLRAALLLTVLMVFLGEVIAPLVQHKAITNKSEATSGGQALVTMQGIWLKNQSNFVHIESVGPDGHLKNILRYEFDSQYRLSSSSFAKEGFYDQGTWVFHDVTETKFGHSEMQTNFLPEQKWQLSLSPQLLGLTNVDTQQKDLVSLYKYIKYRRQSGLNADQYNFIFWQRIFQPLAILVMILLSVPFILGFLRSTSMGLRILIGACFGFGFYILNQFIGPLALVYQLPAVLVASLPTLCFAVFGYILLLRVR